MSQQAERNPGSEFNKGYFGADNYGVPGGYEAYDNSGFWENTLASIGKYLPDTENKTYLDLGCAFGYLLKRAPFAKRVGVDLGEYPLRKAQQTDPGAGLVLADITSLPFEAASFDCITALDVVEHTHNFGETVKEIGRTLKDDGIFVIGTPITDTPEGKIWGKLDRDKTHYSKPSRTELFESLEAAGLEVLECRPYFPLPSKKIKFPRTNMEVVARKTNLSSEELRQKHQQKYRFLRDRETERPKIPESTFIDNPPDTLLVFDNWRGTKPQQQELAWQTMRTRAEMAAMVYNSDLYKTEEERPVIYCFAGYHQEGFSSGSASVKNILLGMGIPEEKIVAQDLTNTTRWDITKLHSEMTRRKLETALILTTDDHVPRTRTAIRNHFARHCRTHGPAYPIPDIFVAGPSNPEWDQLVINGENPADQIARLRKQSPRLDHGFGEKVAGFLTEHESLESILTVIENLTHPHTPKKLEKYKKINS